MVEWLTINNVETVLDYYEKLGPLFAIFLTLFIGKPVMIFLMSCIRNDLYSIITSPKKIFVVALLFAAWSAGKLAERYLNKKVERDLRAREKGRDH